MNASASPPPALQAQIAAARVAAAQGRIAEAEQHFRQLVELLPELAEGLNFLGMCALARQETTEAIALFERARKVAPDDAETLKNLGQAHRRAGHPEGDERAGGRDRVDTQGRDDRPQGPGDRDRRRSALHRGVR